jgi:WD40 repeat protein
MRVIETFTEPVRAIAASPDGRFLAALGRRTLSVHDWASGERLWNRDNLPAFGQVLVTHRGQLVFHDHGWLSACELVPRGRLHRISSASFSGAIATSPDGRTLVATRSGAPQQVKLEKWELPDWRPAIGVEYWSPFTRLAFSPNGEHIAGINGEVFELRFGQSGGLNRREVSPWQRYRTEQRMRTSGRRGGSLAAREEAPPPRSFFLTFPRHSDTVVFGWDSELQVMETRAGAMIKRVISPGDAFVDAAFLGSGRLLATVDGTSAMRLWSAETWDVVREYDWGAGALTCVAASSDGMAGVCGTDAGRMVVFDVDE